MSICWLLGTFLDGSPFSSGGPFYTTTYNQIYQADVVRGQEISARHRDRALHLRGNYTRGGGSKKVIASRRLREVELELNRLKSQDIAAIKPALASNDGEGHAANTDIQSLAQEAQYQTEDSVGDSNSAGPESVIVGNSTQAVLAAKVISTASFSVTGKTMQIQSEDCLASQSIRSSGVPDPTEALNMSIRLEPLSNKTKKKKGYDGEKVHATATNTTDTRKKTGTKIRLRSSSRPNTREEVSETRKRDVRTGRKRQKVSKARQRPFNSLKQVESSSQEGSAETEISQFTAAVHGLASHKEAIQPFQSATSFNSLQANERASAMESLRFTTGVQLDQFGRVNTKGSDNFI